MKTITLAIAILLVVTAAQADRVTLDNPETLSVPSSSELEWRVTLIDTEARKLHITYQWVGADGSKIHLNGKAEQTWVCMDIPTPGTNAECLTEGSPYPCCTGAQSGSCDGMDDSCFSDVLPAWRGVRTLIFNQWRGRVLKSPGNDGTFEER
jgi:hypothetical protein